MSLSVAIYLFPGVEVLDFAGPFEVFTTASRVHGGGSAGGEGLFEVFTVGREVGLVRARAGLEVKAEYGIGGHPGVDLLVIPGGVVEGELGSGDVIEWIREQARGARITASVCTGAFLLAAAGLLRGGVATTHWDDVEALRRGYPDIEVVEGRRWVDLGRVVTSGGIAAGIDMSLHLVERLAGGELAGRTARVMEVDWPVGG